MVDCVRTTVVTIIGQQTDAGNVTGWRWGWELLI